MGFGDEEGDFQTYLNDLIFSTALFGKSRGYINWLEFWVYMCSNGNEPAESEYMVPEDTPSI